MDGSVLDVPVYSAPAAPLVITPHVVTLDGVPALYVVTHRNTGWSLGGPAKFAVARTRLRALLDCPVQWDKIGLPRDALALPLAAQRAVALAAYGAPQADALRHWRCWIPDPTGGVHEIVVVAANARAALVAGHVLVGVQCSSEPHPPGTATLVADDEARP